MKMKESQSIEVSYAKQVEFLRAQFAKNKIT